VTKTTAFILCFKRQRPVVIWFSATNGGIECVTEGNERVALHLPPRSTENLHFV
jgi:hypothetical protein